MTEDKSSISKARSYAEIREFWDELEWKRTKKVKFDVVLEPQTNVLLRRKDLSEKIHSLERKRGFL